MSIDITDSLKRLLLRGDFVRWWRRFGDVRDVESFEAAWNRFKSGELAILRDKRK